MVLKILIVLVVLAAAFVVVAWFQPDDFVKPFAVTNTTEFSLQPAGAQTTLTWKMIGGFFEQGFENLRLIVEKTPQS